MYRKYLVSYCWVGSSGLVGGMAITSTTTKEKLPVTLLVGHLIDQAALSGVFNTLYELHLPLLSVENLDEQV
jgi:hypothetical protein